MRPLSRPLTRRTVHGVLAGAIAVPLTGCDLLPESKPAPSPAPTADELLVDRVASAIRTARAAAASVPAGRSLVVVHDAHLAALGVATPSGSPTATGSPAVADLRSAEATLEATLTDAGNRADDGGLARLLASMAASIAQHLATLPSGAGR
ncbi:hypothetical protein [Nocardioides sp. CER19]|uniref:hypothetical protein n=1 Tax=Nocardioides sp. CER19 TaxID=3038538 RepID=UPI002449BBB5|nr:hypothetical protein [Nocardioides sp. CER19]MDH2416836.1 hypothetical protein [Nocardioides sp. CER19]